MFEACQRWSLEKSIKVDLFYNKSIFFLSNDFRILEHMLSMIFFNFNFVLLTTTYFHHFGFLHEAYCCLCVLLLLNQSDVYFDLFFFFFLFAFSVLKWKNKTYVHSLLGMHSRILIFGPTFIYHLSCLIQNIHLTINHHKLSPFVKKWFRNFKLQRVHSV